MSLVEALSEAFVEDRPDEAAAVAERFGGAGLAALLVALPRPLAARLLGRVTAQAGSDAMGALADADAGALVDHLDARCAAVLLRPLPRDAAEARLAHASRRAADCVRALLAHPPGTAGALMDPAVLAMARESTAGEALDAVRAQPQRCRHYLYVTERGGPLVGVLSFVQLIASDADTRLGDIMEGEVARLRASDSSAAVRVHPGWQTFRALPVVGDSGQLLGAIGRDTYLRLQREAGEGGGAESISLAVSLAELYWRGLTGMTEGFAAAGERSGGR